MFACGEAAGNTCEPKGRPSCRGELALLFLVQEGRPPRSGPEVGRRGEVALLFLVQGGGRRGGRREGEEGGGTRLKSSNPNTEGGE